MSIESYVGVEGIVINIETPEELYDALDMLHTQVMDNLNANPQLLKLLSDAMDRLDEYINFGN